MLICCKCIEPSCVLTVDLSAAEAGRIPRDATLIVDGCPKGPDPGDVLVKQEKGYALYRAAKEP